MIPFLKRNSRHYGLLISQHIFDSVKQSLERLQLNYIDVLQCEYLITNLVDFSHHAPGHKFDYDTPISETVYLISIQPFV